MRAGQIALLGCCLTLLGACGHNTRTAKAYPQNRLQMGFVSSDKPMLMAGVTTQLTPQTRAAVRVRAGRAINVRWDARAGMPQQAALWRIDASQSFVAWQGSDWQLRVGAWPYARARPQPQSLVSQPNTSPINAPAPWGLMLAYSPSTIAGHQPEVAVSWGASRRPVAAGRWAWRGDAWQPAIACTSAKDCPGKSVCTPERQCVAQHGLSAAHKPIDRFALEDGMHVTRLRLDVRQRVGQGALGLVVDGERHRLMALREAHATLMSHRRPVGDIQHILNAVLQGQWGRQRGPRNAQHALFDADSRLDDAAAAMGTSLRPAHSFARASLSQKSNDATALRLDVQQAVGLHRVGAGARVNMPAPLVPNGSGACKKATHEAYLKWGATPLPRIEMWLAPQWTGRPGAKVYMQCEMGIRRDDRSKKGWAWQARLWQTKPASDASAAAPLRTQWQLAHNLHTWGDATLRASLGIYTHNEGLRALSGSVRWRSQKNTLQLHAAAQWTTHIAQSKSGDLTPSAAPMRMRLSVRYAAAGWLACVNVAAALWHPTASLSASVSMPL